MSDLGIRFSSAVAYRISWILRPGVSAVAAARCSGVSDGSFLSTLRTYCMVSVDAPWVLRSPRTLDTMARRRPLTSTAPCS